MGYTPVEAIINLIKNHKDYLQGEVHVLDLGCGKGAVSVKLAREFGFICHGIDGMPEFIEEANHGALKCQVQSLCRFEIGDIRKIQPDPDLYDIIILGSVGAVLGNPEETFQTIRRFLKSPGFIILADAYLPDESSFRHPQYYYRRDIIRAIQNNHLLILDEQFDDKSAAVRDNEKMYDLIESRARELSERYPNDINLFTSYLRAQRKENDVLENEVISVTWLLQRR